MGPKNPRSSVLTLEDEAIILAYRWHTRLSPDDSLARLRRLMPKLSRPALYRCLKRRGLSKIGRTAKCSPLTSAALSGPYCFELTANEVGFPDDDFGVVSVFLAVEEVTKHAEVAKATSKNAVAFPAHLVAEFPQRISAVNTDASPIFTDWIPISNEDMAAASPHPFAVPCRAMRIAHTRTIPPYPKEPLSRRRGSHAVEVR
jgi:hypothetical protein